MADTTDTTAPESAPPPGPPAKPLSLREENAKLKARIAELETLALAQAGAPREVQTSALAGTPGKYRVKLEGVKSRVLDDQERVSYVDWLEVEAVSAGDAQEQFKAYNGILSTSARFHVEALPAPPPPPPEKSAPPTPPETPAEPAAPPAAAVAA